MFLSLTDTKCLLVLGEYPGLSLTCQVFIIEARLEKKSLFLLTLFR